jgi:hypothetical protein
MSENFVYANPPSSGSSATIISAPGKKPIVIQPRTILIVTILILLLIIIIAFILARTSTPETIEQTVETGIIDLAQLIDLSVNTNGCCKPPASTITNTQYIYDTESDFTYTFAQTSPDIVCQTLAGTAKQECLNFVTDTTPGANQGKGKILAHLGIQYYYAFAPGEAGGVCELYTTCPPYP